VLQVIDPQTEPLLTLPRACHLAVLKRDGKPLNLSTIWRWVVKGHKGIRLESLRVGGRVLTTEGAIARFLITCAGQPEPTAEVETPRQRSKKLKRAERELVADGV
jgi:hypothetical protein